VANLWHLHGIHSELALKRLATFDAVKNQYFGDARDYFKYDVLESILAADADFEQLTSIWMLSAPGQSGQGRVRFVPDPELPELTNFFHQLVRVDVDLGLPSEPLEQRLDGIRNFAKRTRERS